MKANGIWVSPTEFVQFGESRRSLSDQIATRGRSIDFQALGMYLPNPDPVLKAMGKDIKIYRDLRSDAHVGGCIRRRKGSVLSLEHGLDRGKSTSRVGKQVESILARLNLKQVISQMLDAPLYGYQPLEILWDRVGKVPTPVAIVGKPPEWFVYDQDNQPRMLTKASPIQGELLPDHKFLFARQDPTYDNPYGFPDLSMVFWPTTFKKGGLKFWVRFTEKYGSPWVIGKHPRSTQSGETDTFLDALEALVQDAVGVIPDDSSVEIMEAVGKTGSADIYERLLMFCRSEVSIAMLGQNQTTEASSTRASATAGQEVTDDIRDSDKSIVEEQVNAFIESYCAVRFGDVERPVWSMWEQEDVDKVRAERDERLRRAGATFTTAYFKRTYGMQDGDLAEPVAPGSGAEFAEAAPPADQDALDAALDALSPDDLNAEAQAMWAPIMQRIKSGMKPDELLGELAEMYPALNATDLQERLARALFVAKVWGRLHG